MRIPACSFIFACAAAFAQNAPVPEQEKAAAPPPNAAIEALKKRMEQLNLFSPVKPGTLPSPQNQMRLETAPLFKPAVCAVPLVNVVPPGTRDKMPAVRPPANPRESGDTVKVPAPACESGTFRNLPQPQIEPLNP